MIKIPTLVIMVTILTTSIVNAGVSSKVYEHHTDTEIFPPKGAYYIGDYKRIDGSIAKDCYAEILRSDDGVAMGTSIVCPDEINHQAGK